MVNCGTPNPDFQVRVLAPPQVKKHRKVFFVFACGRRKDSNGKGVGKGATGPFPYRRVLKTEGSQSAGRFLLAERFDSLPPPQSSA